MPVDRRYAAILQPGGRAGESVGLLSVHLCEIDRYPLIPLAFDCYMTEAGELQMRAAQQIAFLGRTGEFGFALGFGGRAVAVERNRDGGVGELHGADVDQVADEHQHLALALDHIFGVARRVPLADVRMDAGRQFGIFIFFPFWFGF